MSAKKYLRMPAQTVAAKNESEERMMVSLRKHVFYERQRKKQEQEAEVEEERLRKEREARERRDVMTLGQTREKIQALEVRHRELQEKKQELFLTLKKLLNEDENRKKQQQKESNDMYAIHNLMPQPGSFMPPRPMQQDRMPQGPNNQNNNNNPNNNSGNNNHNQGGGPPGGGQGQGQSSSSAMNNSMHSRPGSSSSSGPPSNMNNQPPINKRTRSPSPTPQHGHYYKGGIGGSGQQYNTHGAPSEYPSAMNEKMMTMIRQEQLINGYPLVASPEIEEGRRVGEVNRAVLWHKPNQYSNTVPGGMFYQAPPMPNPSVDASGRGGGHPANFFPYSTIPSQHLRPNYVEMAHMAAAAAAAGQKPPDMGKITLEKLEYPPQVSYHDQERNKQQQQQHAPQPGMVYDYFRSIHQPIMPQMGPGGVGPPPGQQQQQQQGKPSITRGYMKRGMND